MLFITSVPFCRTLDPAGKDELPCFVQVIVVFKSLSTKHGRWTVEPAIGVISFGGRTLNLKRENTMRWNVPAADPRIFSALQMYVPLSFFVTL